MLQNGRMLCLKSVPTGQSIMEQTSGNIDDDLNIFLSEFVLDLNLNVLRKYEFVSNKNLFFYN
jgi:hypothetical protein